MVDYEKILKAIDETNVCGFDVRQDQMFLASYIKLKEIRSSLRKEERKKIETDSSLVINKIGWEEVVLLSNELLCNCSKDIEISVWLLEGLTRICEFEGLHRGLEIIYQLLEKYGTNLYPREELEQEDYDLQLAPLFMLSGKYEIGTIIAPIYSCNILKTYSEDSYNVWEFKKLLEEGNNTTQNKNEVTKEAILRSSTIELIINDLDKEFFSELKINLISSISNFNKLNDLLSKLFGKVAPSLVNINNALLYCKSILDSLIKIVDKTNPEDLVINQEKVNNGSSQINLLDYENLDKKTAMTLLGILVEFFRNSEPHSPISYSLERILHWGNLTLPEILCDLITDDSRAEYCKISGVPFIPATNPYEQE